MASQNITSYFHELSMNFRVAGMGKNRVDFAVRIGAQALDIGAYGYECIHASVAAIDSKRPQ
jgi:hypothetical protein